MLRSFAPTRPVLSLRMKWPSLLAQSAFTPTLQMRVSGGTGTPGNLGSKIPAVNFTSLNWLSQAVPQFLPFLVDKMSMKSISMRFRCSSTRIVHLLNISPLPPSTGSFGHLLPPHNGLPLINIILWAQFTQYLVAATGRFITGGVVSVFLWRTNTRRRCGKSMWETRGHKTLHGVGTQTGWWGLDRDMARRELATRQRQMLSTRGKTGLG